MNRLDKPLDLKAVAAAAGAPYVAVTSAYQKDLADIIQEAILYKGFSVVEIQGLCPGRYTKRNKISPKSIADAIAPMQEINGEIAANVRTEYGEAYRAEASALAEIPRPTGIEKQFDAPREGEASVSLLGSAGQRAITAGELVGIAGLSAGLHVTQKNEYNITVLRGPSITELTLSPEPIGYTGIVAPDVILAVAPEGVERRMAMFSQLGENSLVIQAAGVEIPGTKAKVLTVNFKELGLKNVDWSLASVAVMAGLNKVISMDMLMAALKARFRGKVLESASELVQKVAASVA